MGSELLRRIRALPHGRAIPVLCLSGFIARMDEARALTDGFEALLIKPVDPIELLDMLRLQLDRPKPLMHMKRGKRDRCLWSTAIRSSATAGRLSAVLRGLQRDAGFEQWLTVLRSPARCSIRRTPSSAACLHQAWAASSCV